MVTVFNGAMVLRFVCRQTFPTFLGEYKQDRQWHEQLRAVKSSPLWSNRRLRMDWRKVLACITGAVDEELLLRNEYLAAENRILMEQSQG